MPVAAKRDQAEAALAPRRTHEERSAATRAKLIEAAIYCLHKSGYAATTTTLVAERAKLSRGAMLHQFGTKVDLMLAVARHVVERQNQFYEQALRRYPRGVDRFNALTEVTWEALSKPPAMALLEIMMASRSDRALASRFPLVAAELKEAQSEGLWRAAQVVGITDRRALDALSLVTNAVMHGLSIQQMFTKDRKELRDALQLIYWNKRNFTLAALAEAQRESDTGRRESFFLPN